ncbi:MAG: type II secretion system protein GspD [Longimicrobiales bacterium]
MPRMRAVALALSSIVLLQLHSAVLAAQVRPAQGGVNLNFQDADLAYVLSALAQAANVNIIYSNLPARPVTLRTFQPVPASELIALIYSLAAANGVSVTEGSGFIRLLGPGLGDQLPLDMRQLYIQKLRHARAPALAQTLQAIFGITTIGNQRALTPQTLNQQLQQLQQQQQPQVARPVAPIVVGGNMALQGSVLIVPDEATNQLLIRATPADYQIIQQAIQSLDLRPLQVLIEVVIAEVRRTKDLDVGVTFGGEDLRNPDRNVVSELPRVDAPDNFIVRYTRVGEVNIEATLSALALTGNVRILSRPVIQAQNNQEARIAVGEQRPFVAVSRQFATDQPVRDDVVQYRDVATTLNITPTINADGYVNLAITQEVNNASNELQFGAPVITTRSAVTQLLARDGQTVVIGGLIDNQEEHTRSGIPYLRDIPIIGWLFGSLRRTNINSELFLFLTPHIVESDADADRIRNEIERNAEELRKIAPIRPLVRPIQRPDTIRR